MAFENSPRLDQPDKPGAPARPRFVLNRRGLLAVLGLALAFLLLAIGLAAAPKLRPAEPGGLDGCLQTQAGQPLANTTVSVGTNTRLTGADGCFFWASLPAGDYQMVITAQPQNKVVPVKIESGKAAELGTITVP